MPQPMPTLFRSPARWRRLPLLAACTLVLVAHAILLGSLPAHDGNGAAPAVRETMAARNAAPVLQTRSVVLAVPAAEVPAEAAPVVNPAAPVVDPAVPVVKPLPPSSSRPTTATESPSPPAASLSLAVAATEPAPPAAAPPSPAPAEPPAAEGTEVPTYRTRMPPAARLSYELQRGIARGTGELVWAPSGAAYTLGLQGRALGLLLIGWDSRGGFDAAGIAPERYVDTRRGRDAQAANFRRDSGRITFSGPATELPLAPGTQDRLSWMLQLPAIVEAAPARFEPGAQIVMWVVGARGDMGVWTFAVEARETIAVPAGSVSGALRLKREPRKPYDTQVEVWLDPARHHLPVQVRMSVPQSGDMTEFLLQDARFP